MTTSRLAILLAIVLAGLSSVFILPQKLGFQPVGIELQLPEYLGAWWGHAMQVSQKEKETLGPDTEFARKEYDNGLGARVLASIVLAGEDMMTGIHRPERCLSAQGWTFAPPSARTIEVPGAGKLEVMRVQNTKSVTGPDGKPIEIRNICYYWFAGSKDLTPSHYERVWIDSRDRILGGYVQRWAMIMVAADITEAYDRFGRTEEQTDKLLTDFVAQLAPKVHKPTLQYH